MSKIRLTKLFHFEMAHVLTGYDGSCANIHGHSYHLEITVIGNPINDVKDPKNGMVMDFGDLKRIVKENVIDRFDHVLLLRSGTEISNIAMEGKLQKVEIVDYQPTCENFLVHISEIISSKLPPFISLHHLKLTETPTSIAEWWAEDNQ